MKRTVLPTGWEVTLLLVESLANEMLLRAIVLTGDWPLSLPAARTCLCAHRPWADDPSHTKQLPVLSRSSCRGRSVTCARLGSMAAHVLRSGECIQQTLCELLTDGQRHSSYGDDVYYIWVHSLDHMTLILWICPSDSTTEPNLLTTFEGRSRWFASAQSGGSAERFGENFQIFFGTTQSSRVCCGSTGQELTCFKCPSARVPEWKRQR